MTFRFSLAITCLTLCHVAPAEERLPNSPPPSLGVAEFYRKLYRPGILIVVAPRPAFPVPPAKFGPPPSRGAKTKTETPAGAELEQVVGAGLYSAFAEERELTEADLLTAVNDTVPLYETYEDQIKELRDWARGRARMASFDPKMADLFS